MSNLLQNESFMVQKQLFITNKRRIEIARTKKYISPEQRDKKQPHTLLIYTADILFSTKVFFLLHLASICSIQTQNGFFFYIFG